MPYLTGDVIIRTDALSKRYGKKQALDKLGITMKRGHIYGLIGNNGSGKTTLLRLLTGLTQKNGGTLELFGSSDEKGLRAARRSIGALVETPSFYQDLSVRQNLIARAMLLGKVDKKRIDQLRAMFVLTDREVGSGAIHHCSLGQKQRYGIAAALIGDPELLLLDEPLNGLDPTGVYETREILAKLNSENGITMLISSHLLVELHRLATDYIFIDHGKLVEQVSAQELDSRIEARGLKDVEEYFITLVRSASAAG